MLRKWSPQMLIGAVLVACLFASSCAPKNKDPDVWFAPSSVQHTDSFETIKAAADNGDPNAMYLIGTYTSVQEKGGVTREQAQEYILKAAQKRHSGAEHTLVRRYTDGMDGYRQDYGKVIYWSQRITCDRTAEHTSHRYLAALYEGNAPTPEEAALIKPNLPLAYAHYTLAHKGFLWSTSEQRARLEKQMTDDELKQAEHIVELFRNGGCPYGN